MPIECKKQHIHIIVECDEKLSWFINGNLIEQAIVNLSTLLNIQTLRQLLVQRRKESSLHIEVADEGFVLNQGIMIDYLRDFIESTRTKSTSEVYRIGSINCKT